MRLAEIIKEYGSGKSDKAMIALTDKLSAYLEKVLSIDDYCKLCKEVYYQLAGGHYNKDFADMQISKMYYEDKTGKHYAPFWTEPEAKEFYLKYKSYFPSDYNFYDFEVALNMIKSDYCPLLRKWEQASQSEIDKESHMSKIIDLTINWLNDPDNPYGNEKVWGYFNSNK